jgi:glycerol kinase
MQFQADMLGRPVLQNASADVSALGAVYLAGLKTGQWQSLEEITQLPRLQTRFEPQMAAHDREALYAGWQMAVARALLGSKPTPSAFSHSLYL